jgi:hypothetical protein
MATSINDRYNPSRQLKVNEDGSIDTQLFNDGSIVSSANPLPVKATINADIQLGAVELKNSTDDTRAIIKSDGTNNALVITQNNQPLPTGASTELTQQNLLTLIETLQELINKLTVLSAVKGIQESLRVQVISVPSTAVTGPITSAQSIAEKNVAGVSWTTEVAMRNLLTIQSNINNMTGV